MKKLPLALVVAAVLAIPVPSFAQTDALRLKTVVIDAGHGGKDAGCVSKDKKTYEKDIVLDIATRLQKKISAAYKDVNAIMTRSDDHFVELEQRAVIANKANANLFISIHVNAAKTGTTARGYSVHVLGQSQRAGNDLYSKNLDLVKRENSVILLEDNYETKYQGFDPNDPQSSIIFSLMQNAHLTASLTFADDVAQAMKDGPIKKSRGVSQDPFWVLWRTAMPAVLIEVGFMTNPDDLETIRSEEGREGIADSIFKAFCVFKTRYDGEDKAAEAVSAPVETTPAEEAQPAPANTDEPLYGIQILAIGKKMDPADPFFHGYKALELQAGKLYKYIICTDSKLSNVKKSFAKVQQIFKDSYLVKVTDGLSAPVR
ncbi:MAG: N-acetylmuramoyl-L-alanine amidase [Bacteroidales bacterium]|nr:N-acetylmuramoyl-L-alanine amidase [Bacteroidales bacterium]